MDGTIGFSWYVLYRTNTPLFGRLSRSHICNLAEPASYFNRISARDPSLYHPIELSFTNLFHVQLHRALMPRVGSIKGKNFPYTFDLKTLRRGCRFSVSVQIFLPDLISLRLVCHDQFEFSEIEAFQKRQLHSHPDLIFMADSIAKIVSDEVCHGLDFKRLQSKPVNRLHYDLSDNTLISSKESLSVALLINDEQYASSNDSIRKRVIEANAAHNMKGERSKRILINKQGYLAITNSNSASSPLAMEEIKKRERMYELGCVLQRFYETYPSIRQDYVREADYLFFATVGYIKRPNLTFDASYGNTLAWNVICESFMLVEAFNHASRFDVASDSKLSNLFDRIPRPEYASNDFWRRVREILGEEYMVKSGYGTSVNISGDNFGPIAAGDNSTAVITSIGQPERQRISKLAEQLAQLRNAVAEGAKREEFDEAVVTLRKEIKSDTPSVGRLKKTLGVIRSIGEGIAGKAIAATIVAEIAKLLGF